MSVPNTTDPDEQPRSGRRPAQHRRSLRERLVGGEVARTLLSIWWWLTFGIGIVLWLPMVAIVRVVTAPFDKGRYWAGFLFRKLPVVHQHINPLWTFKVSGKMPSDDMGSEKNTMNVMKRSRLYSRRIVFGKPIPLSIRRNSQLQNSA